MRPPAGKRALDVTASLTALVLLAPLLGLLALWVRLDSPGPVLFARRGWAGRACPSRSTSFAAWSCASRSTSTARPWWRRGGIPVSPGPDVG